VSYSLPPLPWLRSFEAAARHGSFTAAAKELNLTQAAISHQVRSLEKYLGFQLFERLARTVRLTEMGSAYLPPVRKAFDELAASTAGLFGPLGEQSIWVRAPVSYAVLWLAPRLKQFLDAYPRIDVRLFSAVWADALTDERTEIDIRWGDGHWPGFKSEMLIRSGSIPVIHPDLIKGGSPRTRLRELATHNLIHVTGYEDLWQRLFRQEHLDAPTPSRSLNVDTSLAALELACSGVGPAIVLECFAAPYIASGRLTAPIDVVVPSEQSHYLLIADSRSRTRPEVMLFREWLLDVSRPTQPLK
jgi:LysR family glycine cleavage system transcriptional activator